MIPSGENTNLKYRALKKNLESKYKIYNRLAQSKKNWSPERSGETNNELVLHYQ